MSDILRRYTEEVAEPATSSNRLLNNYLGNEQPTGTDWRRDPLWSELIETAAHRNTINVFANRSRNARENQIIQELTERYGVDSVALQSELDQNVEARRARQREEGQAARQERDQQMRSIMPINDTPNRLITNAQAGSVVLEGARQLSKTLEPVQMPADALQATIAGRLDPNSTMTERLGAMEWAQYAPRGGEPARPATGEEIVRLSAQRMGVEENVPEGVYKWGGIAADLTIDPLIFGSIVTGIGKAGKLDDVVKLGQQMEAAVAPATYVRGAGKAADAIPAVSPIKQAMNDAAVRGMNELFNVVMPFPTIEGKSKTFGEWVSAEGRNPLDPDTDFLTVKPGTATPDRPAELAGKTGRPPELIETARRGKRVAEEMATAVDERLTAIYDTLGEARGRKWMGELVGGLGLFQKAATKASKYPQEMRDAMIALASDVVSKRGVLIDDEAIQNLKGVRLGVGRRENTAWSVGDELEGMAKSMPPQVNIALDDGLERVEALAKKYNKNVAESATDFRTIVRKMTEADAIVGFHSSLYAPLKETFYQNLGSLGGSPELAERVWSQMLAEGMGQGPKLGGSGFNRNRWVWEQPEVKDPNIYPNPPSPFASGERITQATPPEKSPFTLRSGGAAPAGIRSPDPYNTGESELARRLREARGERPPSVFTDKVTPGPNRAKPTDFSTTGEAFQGRGERPKISQGLRDNLEALKQGKSFTPEKPGIVPNYEEGIDGIRVSIERGEVYPSWQDVRALEDEMGDLIPTVSVREIFDHARAGNKLDLDTYFRGAPQGHMRRTFGAFQDPKQAKRYVQALEERAILPSRIISDGIYSKPMMERGFQREADLINDYIESVSPRVSGERGVAIRQASLLRHMVENGVDPKRAKDAVGALIEATNPQFKTEVLDKIKYYSAKQEQIREPTIAGRFGRIGQERDVTIDPDFLEALGQITEPAVTLGEQGRVAAKAYPHAQFIHDAYALAKQKGIVRRYNEDMDIPDGYTPLANDSYGPFKNTLVPHALKRELDNSFSATKEGRFGGLARVRSAITGGWLANPASTAVNLAGGFYSSYLQGLNPLILGKHYAEVMRDRHKLKGALPELEDMGDLLNTSMKTQELARYADTDKLVASGITKAGFGDWLNGVGRAYQGFLDAPLGRNELGLNGFEYTEENFKIATYRMMREGGASVKEARNIARNVVFDYSELPEILNLTKTIGLTPFVGFPVFMAARTAKAFMQRPGTLALSDRLSDAVWNATMPDEETRYAAYGSLADWQKKETFVPLSGPRENANGFDIVPMLPLGQVFPTTALDAPLVPFAESATSGGAYTAIFDLVNAVSTGTGEAGPSSKYGATVFNKSSGPLRRIAETGAFLHRSLAPGVTRKALSYNTTRGEFEGLLPAFARAVENLYRPMPQEMADLQRGLDRREQRNLFEEVMTFGFRSITPVSLDPATSAYRKAFDAEKMDVDESIKELELRTKRFISEGNMREAQKAQEEIYKLKTELFEKHMPTLQALSQYYQSRRR